MRQAITLRQHPCGRPHAGRYKGLSHQHGRSHESPSATNRAGKKQSSGSNDLSSRMLEIELVRSNCAHSLCADCSGLSPDISLPCAIECGDARRGAAQVRTVSNYFLDETRAAP